MRGSARGAAHILGQIVRHPLPLFLAMVPSTAFSTASATGFGHALPQHGGRGGDAAAVIHHQRHHQQSGKGHGAAVLGQALAFRHQHPPIHMDAARRHFVDQLGRPGARRNIWPFSGTMAWGTCSSLASLACAT